MTGAERIDAARFWALLLLSAAFCVYAGRAVTQWSPALLLGAAAAVGVAMITFASPRLGLTIVVFSMIFSPKFGGPALSGNPLLGSVIFKINDGLLIIIFLAALARAAIVRNEAFIVRTPANLPIFLSSGFCILSTGLGVMRGDLGAERASFYVLKYVEYYLIYFLTLNIVVDRRDVRRYLRYGWITAALVTVYGYWLIPQGARVTAPFDEALGGKSGNEANTFGGYYLIVFSMLLGHFIYGDGSASWWAWASLLYMMPPFLMTLSRSSYIGLAGTLAFLTGASARRRLTLVFSVGVILFSLYLIPPVRESVEKRILYTFTGEGAVEHLKVGAAGTLSLEGSAMARVTSWRDILTVHFPRHPFVGSGVTGVGLVDVQYPRVIGETGVFGAFFFFWILYRLWWTAWRLYRESSDPQDKALAMGFLAALVGLGLHGFGANTFIIVRIMEPFWFIAALVSRSFVNLSRTPAHAPDPGVRDQGRRRAA